MGRNVRLGTRWHGFVNVQKCRPPGGLLGVGKSSTFVILSRETGRSIRYKRMDGRRRSENSDERIGDAAQNRILGTRKLRRLRAPSRRVWSTTTGRVNEVNCSFVRDSIITPPPTVIRLSTHAVSGENGNSESRLLRPLFLSVRPTRRAKRLVSGSVPVRWPHLFTAIYRVPRPIYVYISRTHDCFKKS